MNEIAKATAHTALAAVESTTRFAEIGNGREFAVDRATSVPTTIEGIASFLGVLFVLETYIDVANQICFSKVSIESPCVDGEKGAGNARSLLLSQTTSSSTSPYWHSSHQMSS